MSMEMHTLRAVKLTQNIFAINRVNRELVVVRKRVRWELGSEGMAVWDACGYKDIPTLAKAYRIS